MSDWQQYAQTIFFGLIFSFLLAKLFSIIFSFRDQNLRITRANSDEDQSYEKLSESDSEPVQEEKKQGAEFPRDSNTSDEEKPLVGQGKENAWTSSDTDDDWEGVESTELDEAFSAATAFVAATAADRSSPKVSTDLQLQLYGLYKIATEGPCSVPQPSALKMTARAKW